VPRATHDERYAREAADVTAGATRLPERGHNHHHGRVRPTGDRLITAGRCLVSIPGELGQPSPGGAANNARRPAQGGDELARPLWRALLLSPCKPALLPF